MREGLDQFSSWSLKANQDGGKSWLIRGQPRQIKERTYSKAIEWKKKTWEHDRPVSRLERSEISWQVSTSVKVLLVYGIKKISFRWP